jgi:hypothetical protein
MSIGKMRIVEYKIAIASSHEALATEVNRLIKDRWQPFGGLVVVREPMAGIMQSFMQPMVREPKKRAGNLSAQNSEPPPTAPKLTP